MRAILWRVTLSVLAVCVMSGGVSVSALAQQSPNVVMAQQAVPNIIRSIRVMGTLRIEPKTVISYLLVQPGDPFDLPRINESVKRLFATGLFSDVAVDRVGDVLEVKVTENPVINLISFEGNQRIDDDILQTETQLRERMVYTQTRVLSDAERIKQIYQRSGRYGASVVPKIIERPQNRVDLVYEIDEGQLAKVRRIQFIGNRNFSDGTLRNEIQTKESAWYRFLLGGDTYDPDRVTFDRELLRQFYLKNGYADFRVVSAVSEVDPESNAFYVTYTIDEGQQYNVGKITLDTNLPDLKTASLDQLVSLKPGDVYNAKLLDQSVEKIVDAAGTKGFAFVEVTPDLQRRPESKTVDIALYVNEGPRVYVERINIVGNLRTLDEVIRREFRFVEGDPFNTSKLKRTKERLNNLGYFEKVEVDSVPGSAPDQVVINVAVTEQSTGEVSFGAGFSTTESLLGNVVFRERNLLGKGQDLKVGFTLSARRREFDVGFTEPYFLDRPLRAGIDAYNTTRELEDDSSYDELKRGGALRLGFDMNEYLSTDLNYTLRSVTVQNIDSDASRFIREQEGKTITSSVGYRFTYDRRDSRIAPSNGYVLGWSQDIAGLGGDSKYIRSVINAARFYPVAEDWIWSVGGEAGHIAGLSEDVRISDRFFIGGATFRGFSVGGVGPRDMVTDDPLGANTYAVASSELTFPLGLPNEFGMNGVVFTDIGTVTNIDASGPEIVDEASLRATIGAGLAWRSPFGPIRVDFGVPVLKEDFDDTEVVRIDFGTRF